MKEKDRDRILTYFRMAYLEDNLCFETIHSFLLLRNDSVRKKSYHKNRKNLTL